MRNKLERNLTTVSVKYDKLPLLNLNQIRYNKSKGTVNEGVMALSDYINEMLNITKEFPGFIANDNITLQL